MYSATLSLEERRSRQREYTRRWRESHPEVNKAQSRESSRRYRERHPDYTRSHPDPSYYREWRDANPEKRAAHYALREALRKGLLTRPTCCDGCGRGGRLHAHHEDYSRPLQVEWLCPRCHGRKRCVA